MLDTVQQKLGGVSPDDVRLYFITREKDEEEKFVYGVLKTEINQSVSKTLLDAVKMKIAALIDKGDLEHIPYSPGVNPDKNHVKTISKSEVPYIDDILQKTNRADLDMFNVTQSKNIVAYAIKIGREITVFRKCTKHLMLENKGLLSLMVARDGKFDRLTGTVLTLDGNIDCICYRGDVYILKCVGFERIFSFMDKFKEEINRNISNLGKKGLVDDIHLLVELCKTDGRRIKKLHKILKGETLAGLDLDKVRQINTSHKLGLKFTEDGKIEVKANKISAILKVLDDDYVKSPMTGNNYETHSKEKIV